ncbi:MAG: TIGR01777 family protein [Armatimonadetes bacterium CG2_30_59_28]|nr:TIGR01777 family protein [Armatimonadota bacterium]OIO92405.1 MAG: TIGR01777 family protein [Armatimonadetes bacterium CG2_30_59_28]PIU63682.1 MAG: TIGR01777 family protein [Armatimonadetes bacterium CG07_land_8_20_14_0_80_59_28]PIX41878.1 MAG: TIGR01777 family protein [Armatimonadetes bacterium CG_4_8_14_3_um_filter_58_9]PIY48782.1 MAG: TIGR01777 family protein [Armatimonadetes bacterium CG_4_10_14_3_um_filter_59_10]PJB69701.1 MAG: TIGR01777 family protein [Armatimonadetes bacterium CG_4_9
MRVAVTGATGFVGRQLCETLLVRGHCVTVITRQPDRGRLLLPQVDSFLQWDPDGTLGKSLDGVHAVVHLAGESIAGRWSKGKKTSIRNSRVTGTRNLVRSLQQLSPPTRPRVLVSASAIGYYGDCKETEVNESSPAGSGFLPEVCAAWEAEASRAEEQGIRVASVRTGIVLGPGGALQQMLRPFRMGLGGRLGDGRQWMSWIHIEDLIGIFVFALEQEAVVGPINGVAPHPVTNREFTKVLAHVLRRPAMLPVPSFALKMAMGEFADVLLQGQKVLPIKALNFGYAFKYPHLEPALRQVLA